MPLIHPIKATDTSDEIRAKNNAAITRVNELDNTAADIAGMASSANAAMRNASGYRDSARDAATDAEEFAGEAAGAKEATAADRAIVEAARNLTVSARDVTLDAREEALEARDDAISEAAAALISRTASEIAASAALLSADGAQANRLAADDAAARAEVAENSLLEWRGAWAAGFAYSLGDIVRFSGSSYACISAHNSSVFATDLGAGRWDLVAQQGAPGPGSGDMLSTRYDPFGRETNVYERGNHTGEQPINTVTGLQSALNGKAPSAHNHDAQYYTKAQIDDLLAQVYTKGQIDAALALLAPKASPTFTGTVAVENLNATGSISAKGNITGYVP